MPLTFERTPETEKAASYGYLDLLREVVGRVNESRGQASQRLLEGKPTSSDLMEMLFAGVGGVIKKPPVAAIGGKLIKFPKKKRDLTSLLGDLKAGNLEDFFRPIMVDSQRFNKNPEKYSKFLVANYKSAVLQDPDIVEKAAHFILDNKIQGHINFQDRARIALMRIGRPSVVK